MVGKTYFKRLDSVLSPSVVAKDVHERGDKTPKPKTFQNGEYKSEITSISIGDKTYFKRLDSVLSPSVVSRVKTSQNGEYKSEITSASVVDKTYFKRLDSILSPSVVYKDVHERGDKTLDKYLK